MTISPLVLSQRDVTSQENNLQSEASCSAPSLRQKCGDVIERRKAALMESYDTVSFISSFENQNQP